MKHPLYRKLIVWLMLCVILALVGSAPVWAKNTSSAGLMLKKADQCAKSLYASRTKMRYRHHWSNCIKLYEEVVKRYPKSDEAVWALYRCARLHRKLYNYSGLTKDLDRAIELYRKLVDDYDRHRLADDAQYKIGEIYYGPKENPSQAYVEFLKVDIKFPSGDMRPKARTMMDKLSLILSRTKEKENPKQQASPHNTLTEVKDIRHWSTPNYTRVVIDLERPVKYDSHILKADPDLDKPRRLYVDLKKAYVSSNIESSIPIADGLLQRARAGQNTRDSVRVVLDINSIGGHKIFHLYDPYRIVVDVRGIAKKTTAKAKPQAAKKERPVRKGIRKVKQPDKTVSLARQLGLNVKRIVIDPGHGGKDPGCYHKGGIKEKNIVLNLAKALARKVEARLGCEAVLTRTRDVFVPLERRTAFANVQKADLFISLHINAHRQRNVRGLETYFLNMATDKRAVMVAARENATSEKNISDLQTILNDLMLNTKITESSKLAHEVQGGMLGSARKRFENVKNLGVKQAPFYVLIGAEMPAILVETGFITNSVERKRLLNPKYLDTLSEGIVTGIEKYIESIDLTYKGG